MISRDDKSHIHLPHADVVNGALAAGLSESVISVDVLQHQGKINFGYKVRTESNEYILRIKFDCEGTGVTEHRREKKCSDLVREKCDCTPQIVSVGEVGAHSYSFQKSISGKRGSEYKGDLRAIWYQIGEYAAEFHKIEVPGYNYDLFNWDQGEPDKLWCQWYFDYLLDPAQSRLAQSEIVTPEEFSRGIAVIETLADWKFIPHLCHSDLKMENTIITSCGKPYIIDWGTAQGHKALSMDIAELLYREIPQEQIAAFCLGRGVGTSYLKEHRLELDTLQLLRVMLASEWASRSFSLNDPIVSSYSKKLQELIKKF